MVPICLLSHVGLISTSTLSIPDTYHIFKLSLKLLSVDQLVEHDLILTFSSKGCELLRVFHDFKQMIKAQFDCTIKNFLSDKAMEYTFVSLTHSKGMTLCHIDLVLVLPKEWVCRT